MASSFTTLRQRGYGTLYAVRIEGIPYTFHEGPTPYRVDAESAPSAGSGYASSASFVVTSSMSINQELDRDSGVARAKALSLVLSWEVLEAEGILDNLFRRPEYFTTVAFDVNATQTILIVEDTSSFASSGQIYIGRELIKYTGKGGTSFTGCTRGYLSNAYTFKKDDAGSNSIITPTPYAWKGRFVTVHEHLISPEGRILSSTLCTGDYQREIWKGYIAETPVPDKAGMKLKALPLVRLVTQPLGSEIRARVLGVSNDGYWGSTPVNVGIGHSITFTFQVDDAADLTVTTPTITTGAVAGDFPVIPPGIHTLKTYMDAVAADILAAFAAAGLDDVVKTFSTTGNGYDDTGPTGYVYQTKSENPVASIAMTVDQTTATGNDNIPLDVVIDKPPGIYWMKVIETSGDNKQTFTSYYIDGPLNSFVDVFIRFELTTLSATMLPLKEIEGSSILDYTIEDTGMGIVEVGDNSEVIRWTDKVEADAYGGATIVLELGERMVGAEYSSVKQIPADLSEDGTFIIATGKIDDLNTIAETFLQSSGGGTRGAKDTLPLSHGMGIPEEWIDLDATGSLLAMSGDVPMITAGKQSFADMFSGWYQISNACLAMRRSEDGVLQFQIVNVVPSEVISTTGAGFLGRPLMKQDVVVGGTGVPSLVIAPNQINVDTTAGPYESAQYVFNAIGRIQAEGIYNKSLSVPGGHSSIIAAGVLSIMSRGQGQSIIKFDVAPWIDAEVGDPISVTVEHPLLFNWADGTRAPSNIAARVLGWSKNLGSGEQSLTLLLDGILAPALWLCPTTHIYSISGNDVTVARGDFFRSGETLRFYNRGKEATESADLLVTTVSGDVLTMAASPPAWFVSTLTGSHPTKVTYPAYTSGSTDQQNPFMYARSDKYWRA